MKVLLICPKFPFDINKYFNLPVEPYGGWIDGMLSELINYKDIEISYLVFNSEKTYDTQSVNGINYLYINHNDNNTIKEITNDYDVYHIFGIEHHYINYIKDYLDYKKTLLYIAGLQIEYSRVYYANYQKYYNNYNPLLKLCLFIQKSITIKQSKLERIVLEKGVNVTGRTSWDKEAVLRINPNLHYYHCNESLRSKFYTARKWNYETCNKHTIYITQGAYPIKGTHVAINIINKIKEKYPDVVCYISGENLLTANSIMTKFHSSYAYMISKMIKDLNLENNIIFIGPKNEEDVIKELQKANVFLSASVIENSCNSLQEAMLVGVPCVSSKVGGLSSIAEDNIDVLFYDFDDVDKAASNIIRIFEDKELCYSLSNNSIKKIEYFANRKSNAKQMYNIYLDIYNNNKGAYEK